MAYSGGVWTAAYEEDAIDRALSMIVGLPYSEGPSYPDEPEVAEDGKEGPSLRKKFNDWADKQAGHRAMKAAAELARGRAAMRISAATFDTAPDLLNVLNGVVNLRTGELIPHGPEQRMTMQCRAAYDPEAHAPSERRIQLNATLLNVCAARTVSCNASALTARTAAARWSLSWRLDPLRRSPRPPAA